MAWDDEPARRRLAHGTGDAGHSRAAIPFALVQRNANCTHNGMLMLSFSADGGVSRASGCLAERWKDVQLRHLLGMSSGQHDSPAYMADEESPRIGAFPDATSTTCSTTCSGPICSHRCN